MAIICEETTESGHVCGRCGGVIPKKPPGMRGRYRKVCISCVESEMAAQRPPKVCPRCGGSFLPRMGRHQFCSQLCERQASHERRRSSNKPYQPCTGKCFHCQRLLEGRQRRFCDRVCSRRERHRIEPLVETTCTECGVLFTPRAHASGGPNRFCSKACCDRHRWDKWSATRYAKVGSARRVSATKVFQRDGWRCQLCGVKVRRLKGRRFDDRSPHLDHIIPLRAGGEHSYLNVQCLCRKCNLSKGSKALGQLRLFG